MRVEVNISTGDVNAYEATAWVVAGHVVLIDDGEAVPEGATLATAVDGQKGHRQLSVLEFLDCFSPNEQLALVEASMQSASIKLWYDKTLAASFVTISDPRVSAGLSALVSAGLLSEQRMGEIVAAMSA